ncbi:MAG: hypothetical protein R3F11_23405 [Verrucomicrobiales bacterium]
MIGISVTWTTSLPPGRGELVPQRAGSVERVEIKHLVAPAAARHAFDFLRRDPRAGRHHEDVVAQRLPPFDMHLVRRRIDPLDLARYQIDAPRQQVADRLDHIPRRHHPKRKEEKARLVIMVRRSLDGGDPPLVARQSLAQVMRHHGAGGPGPEDKKLFHGFRSFDETIIPIYAYSTENLLFAALFLRNARDRNLLPPAAAAPAGITATPRRAQARRQC